MAKYIMRLDDACEKRNIQNWDRMERLLDAYGIRPLVGIIPHCEDAMMDAYAADADFWDRAEAWQRKGWQIAMHGYNHVYGTDCGGLNPVNNRSEFAGCPYAVQREKIAKGIAILRSHGIEPEIFFAPSHTFDEGTLEALKQESRIRIISDTIADRPYADRGFTFVPQQSGRVRRLPFSVVTFCYHPNTMQEKHFAELEAFLKENKDSFRDFPAAETQRRKSLKDKLLEKLYFMRR